MRAAEQVLERPLDRASPQWRLHAIGAVILLTGLARVWLIRHYPEPDGDAKGHLGIAAALLVHPLNVAIHWVWPPGYHYLLAALLGVGVTANGALVYVGGPGLDIVTLADLLVAAGAVRAVELDINLYWVNFSTYAPRTGGGLAAPDNGSNLLSSMDGGPGRYFQENWNRDFFTMSIDPAAAPKALLVAG